MSCKTNTYSGFADGTKATMVRLRASARPMMVIGLVTAGMAASRGGNPTSLAERWKV